MVNRAPPSGQFSAQMCPCCAASKPRRSTSPCQYTDLPPGFRATVEAVEQMQEIGGVIPLLVADAQRDPPPTRSATEIEDSGLEYCAAFSSTCARAKPSRADRPGRRHLIPRAHSSRGGAAPARLGHALPQRSGRVDHGARPRRHRHRCGPFPECFEKPIQRSTSARIRSLCSTSIDFGQP